jgi:KTSC domain
VNPEEELRLLEQLLDELISGIQSVLESGEELSDEFQGLLAQELEHTTQRISQLQEEVSQKAPPPQQPPSADAQLLWILAGQQEQAFISYLRDFPSPATRSLLANPQELSSTIDYLNRIMPAGQQPFINGIQHADLNSSNIWGTAYDPQTGKMKVRFQGGSEYEYDGVPANIYRAFTKGNAQAKTKGKNQYGEWWVGKNPSLGAAMNQYIKAGNFPYRRIR